MLLTCEHAEREATWFNLSGVTVDLKNVFSLCIAENVRSAVAVLREIVRNKSNNFAFRMVILA